MATTDAGPTGTGMAPGREDLQRGLIGHWRFDAVTDNRVADLSGHGNDGVLFNAATGTGDFAGALDLKGRDDSHVSIPGTPSLRGIAAALTVVATVFPRTLSPAFIVAVSRQVADLLHPDQFYLGFGPEDGVLHYKWHLGLTGGDGDLYRGDPQPGRWMHLAGTFDGATMRLFVDGAEIGALAIAGAVRVDDNPVTIGAEENGPQPHVVDGELDGYVDEVRIYDRALAAAEIAALFEVRTRR